MKVNIMKLSREPKLFQEVADIPESSMATSSDYISEILSHVRQNREIPRSGIKVTVSNDIASKILGFPYVSVGVTSIIQCGMDMDNLEILTDSLLPEKTVIW